MKPDQGELEFVHYETKGCAIDLALDPSNETVWANQQQLAALFGVDRSVIAKHLKNIFDDKELDPEATCAKFTQVQNEGGRQVSRQVDHYAADGHPLDILRPMQRCEHNLRDQLQRSPFIADALRRHDPLCYIPRRHGLGRWPQHVIDGPDAFAWAEPVVSSDLAPGLDLGRLGVWIKHQNSSV